MDHWLECPIYRLGRVLQDERISYQDITCVGSSMWFFRILFLWTWSFELLGINYKVLGLWFWLSELVVGSSLITVLCSQEGLNLVLLGFKIVSRWWLVTDSDFIDKLCLLTVSSTNVSRIWGVSLTFPWLLLLGFIFQLLLTPVFFYQF